MRLFLLFLLLSSHSTFAADCTESDFPFSSCDNIYINGTLDLRLVPGPITFNTPGVVEIKGNILLDGADGTNLSSQNPGGQGGPGATNGGGIGLFSTEDGFDGTTANGKTAPNDATCAGGGGGGGMFTVGNSGLGCPTSGSSPGVGGAVAPATEFDFIAGPLFRGGYGGGAGGINATEVGGGGGGGGALHIIAGGNVTIASGVTISAKGGNGGNALTDGGGGGGGSGGALWIQSTSGIVFNFGTIDLRGGTGGRNNATNAHGGNGGDGVYQFEDVNGTTNGSGLVVSPLPNTASTPKLTSAISCATLAAKETDNIMLKQIMAGFLFAALSVLLLKTLSRIPKKFL